MPIDMKDPLIALALRASLLQPGCGNLALLPTPMAKQALDVHVLTIRHNQIHYERWRHVQVPLQEPS
jgi:hypothetical protein